MQVPRRHYHSAPFRSVRRRYVLAVLPLLLASTTLPANGTAEAFDASGEPLPGVMAFWFAWVAFHPDTEELR